MQVELFARLARLRPLSQRQQLRLFRLTSSPEKRGDVPITVTGTNFEPGASVVFSNGGAASAGGVDCVVTSTTTVTCLTPAFTTGVASATVTNVDGQGIRSFSVLLHREHAIFYRNNQRHYFRYGIYQRRQHRQYHRQRLCRWSKSYDWRSSSRQGIRCECQYHSCQHARRFCRSGWSSRHQPQWYVRNFGFQLHLHASYDHQFVQQTPLSRYRRPQRRRLHILSPKRRGILMW